LTKSPCGRRRRALQIVRPDATFTAWLALIAGFLHCWRSGRWAGERIGSEPLVAILHLGYAFVPVGFVLLAVGILCPDVISATGAVHAWTAGAIGTMTLAVMTRASLGHTGQPLTATTAVLALSSRVRPFCSSQPPPGCSLLSVLPLCSAPCWHSAERRRRPERLPAGLLWASRHALGVQSQLAAAGV